MSKYTTEVRYLCEVEYGASESLGFNSINDVITTAAPKVFNFDFPMFDEAYRLPLEIKILRHYYTREICEESVGLWKLRLQDRLNMIMPYYNQLYSSELIQFNPMYDVDLTKESTKDNEGEKTNNETENAQAHETNLDTTHQNNVSESNTSNTGTNSTATANTTVSSNTSSETNNDATNTSSTSNESSSNNSSRHNSDEKLDKYSDTPQGSVVNLEDDSYLTNARIISDSASETSNGSSTANISSTGNSSNTGARNGETNGNETFSGSSDNSYSSDNINSSSSTDDKTVNRTKDNAVNKNKMHIGTMTNTEEYFEHLIGKTGKNSNSKLLTEFRETFLNIDKMIIEELSDLFFGLWE